jgi:hypothetical protein
MAGWRLQSRGGWRPASADSWPSAGKGGSCLCPGVWLNACSGAKVTASRNVPAGVPAWRGSSRRNANALEFMFHGQPVPLEHRQVRRRRGPNVRAARLDLDGSVRCGLAEHHGQLACRRHVLQYLARLLAGKIDRDPVPVTRHLAADRPHEAGAVARSREPTMVETPRVIISSRSAGNCARGVLIGVQALKRFRVRASASQNAPVAYTTSTSALRHGWPATGP